MSDALLFPLEKSQVSRILFIWCQITDATLTHQMASQQDPPVSYLALEYFLCMRFVELTAPSLQCLNKQAKLLQWCIFITAKSETSFQGLEKRQTKVFV